MAGGLSIATKSEAALITKSPKRVLRIAHLTDVHIQPNKVAANGFEKCLHHLQSHAIKPDFIINGGDAIMEAHHVEKDRANIQWKVYQEVLKSENSLPMISCVGNHDCGRGNLPQQCRRELDRAAIGDARLVAIRIENVAGDELRRYAGSPQSERDSGAIRGSHRQSGSRHSGGLR